MPAAVFVGMVGYLQTRRECGGVPNRTDGVYKNCKVFPEEVSEELDTKYGQLLAPLAVSRKKTNNQIGAVFHLAMLAYMQFEYEFGLSTYWPVDQEFAVEVPLLRTNRKNVTTYGRVVDIVLNVGVNNDPETAIWVEVKSYLGTSVGATAWDLKDDKTSTHREYALDCQAHKKSKQNNTFRWWFHDFDQKRTGEKGTTAKHMSDLNKKLHARPKGFQNSEFGGRGKICNGLLDPNAKLFKIKQQLIGSLFVTAILNGVDSDIVTELINTVDLY